MSIRAIEFSYERYIGFVGYSQQQVWDFDKGRSMPGFIELGIVESSKLHFRPRLDGKSAMLADPENNLVWLHIS